MVRNSRFNKKSSKKIGSYVRHGTLSRNALGYVDQRDADLQLWTDDSEAGHGDFNELTQTEKKNLSRLQRNNIVEMKDAEKQEKIDFIKRLPVSISTKRFIRTKLAVDNEEHHKSYNRWRQGNKAAWKFITHQPFKEWFRFLARNYKSIEAEFGSGVLSYFVFLRWLLSLNCRILLIILAFVVIPQTILHSHDEDEKYITEFATNGTSSNKTMDPASFSVRNLTTYCTALYQMDVNITVDTSDVLSLVRDFIQGTGWMERTSFFYGFYSNQHVTLRPTSFRYNLPLAYLLVVILCFVLSLVLMLWRTRKTMRLNNERKHARNTNEMSKIVLCAWDYTLTNPNPVRLRHKTLHLEIMTILEEEKLQLQRKMRTHCQWLGIFMVRLIVNLIILASLGGAAYLIYYATQVSADFSAEEDYEEQSDVLQLLMDFLPSLTITILNFLIPIMFGFIVKAEKYSPTFELNMTLGRTVFLRLASLAILFATLYYKLTCSSVDMCRVGLPGRCSKIRCWETYTGQQIYRLIVLQIAVEFGSVFLIDFPRRILVNHLKDSYCKWISHAEFNISKTVLDLIYCQTLFWIGIFFAPFISVIAVCSLFTLFFLKQLTLMVNYRPSQKPYRSSRSHTFLMIVLIIAFVLCCVPVGYSIWAITPSRGCGPFRSYRQVWTILTDTIESFPPFLQEIFSFLFSLGFAIPMFIFMAIALYWHHAVGKSRNEYIRILLHQVELENRDKKFLVERFNKIRTSESTDQIQSLFKIKPGDQNENHEATDEVNSVSIDKDDMSHVHADVIRTNSFNGMGTNNEGFT